MRAAPSGGRFHRTGKVLDGPPTADLEHEQAEAESSGSGD